MKIYTEEDCLERGSPESWKGKVIAIKQEAVPRDTGEQLFVCMEEAEEYLFDRKQVPVISLADRTYHLVSENAIIGALKPELLTDEARTQLSMIPSASRPAFGQQDWEFTGYCYLKNGQYSVGVWLHDIDAVKKYLELQEPYQNHIQICDWNDLTVLQVEHGCYVFRDDQMEIKMRQTQSFCGGMMMS